MLSHFIAFLIGAFTGAAGKYLADKYTDRRRQMENRSAVYKSFIKLAEQMPELMKEMQDDLLNPEYNVIREFFVLPNSSTLFNAGGQKYLYYYENQHEDLIHKIKLLENNNFLADVTHTDTPKYRMTEEFVACLVKAKFKSNKVRF